MEFIKKLFCSQPQIITQPCTCFNINEVIQKIKQDDFFSSKHVTIKVKGKPGRPYFIHGKAKDNDAKEK